MTSSSYGRNVVANIISQSYVAVVGIVVMPVLVRLMGAEAFGLIGFFTMLQAWFQLLDLGMTPTLSRETARFCGGAISTIELRRILRALEGLFYSIAFLGAVVMGAGSRKIATSWLNVETLSKTEVQLSVLLMGLVIAMRWVGSIYRGAIAGFERMVWLGGFSVAIATFRFILVIPLLRYRGGRPLIFFGYQAILAIFELIALKLKLYALVPRVVGFTGKLLDWTILKPVVKFSTSIAFTSSIWVLVSQMDKLVLSRMLTLSEFGYFTLAVVVAGGISILSGPVSTALMPRMARLEAEGDEEATRKIYREATQMVGLLVIPASAILSFFAPQVLFAWTGNMQIAMKAAPILRFYAIGNGILALVAFQYYLQFAKGDLRLHIIGNLGLVLLLIPSVIIATRHYGAKGAGVVWVIINLLYFALWTPLVHRRFLPGIHAEWLKDDIGSLVLPVVVMGWMLHLILAVPIGRLGAGFQVIGVGMGLMVVCLMGSSWGRRKASHFLSETFIH